ncbi:MAG: hypothetical protein B1H03_06450 [Planctomycetales bacterium 4484_113]|nr:MAG: hypothetical protein B1H03_06450 [Planctomycetales bacterium 4484_113]
MTMRVHILADESGIPEHGPCLVYGGIWLAGRVHERAEMQLRELAVSLGLRWELKWKKITGSNVERYIRVLHWFFDEREIAFRCLLVDTSSSDYVGFIRQFSARDYQLGFYKLYYFFLTRNIKIDLQSLKWTSHGDTFKVWLDAKPWSRTEQIPTLLKVCNSYLKKACRMNGQCPQLVSILPINSKRSRLLQLADVLAGAVRAENVGLNGDCAKAQFVKELASIVGVPVLTTGTEVRRRKFNVWPFKWK